MTSLRLNQSNRRLYHRLANPLPSRVLLTSHLTPSIHLRPLSTHPLRPPPLANPSSLQQIPPSRRRFSTGKSQADLLVEELQELYETATDEFEIATDSTANSTIYAASDRESARDALNQLAAVYSLYTTELAAMAESHAPQQTQQSDSDDRGQLVNTKFDPSDIPSGVREEVRRRVGQRVRELSNAVEALEERAHAE
ncbi:uncharacterized protein CDV56_108593 [Aspergillus thermomutatus]|uniref:Uncharacterized protein n=1 Tax=Aspergillus thermomutatus TaxID=41047 RepID=A0A397HFA0_ASPTH|nr:uncharacterized protein CDV56_108593 [Aspergillus thermomutatus]RHZ60234.1 hypothetical protein CDV56_108593 [Aspergillus thermomutatus]